MNFTIAEGKTIKEVVSRHGYNFDALCCIRLFPSMCQEFLSGRWNEQTFIKSIVNIDILNGGKMKCDSSSPKHT